MVLSLEDDRAKLLGGLLFPVVRAAAASEAHRWQTALQEVNRKPRSALMQLRQPVGVGAGRARLGARSLGALEGALNSARISAGSRSGGKTQWATILAARTQRPRSSRTEPS